MAAPKAQRKLTAILSADVAGYSRLMGDDEEATIETLGIYREVFTTYVAEQGGRIVDAKGDAILAEFGAVTEALGCAVEIQRELAERNKALSETRRMDFRIGINLGEVTVKGEEIYGDGVNIAARLEALAEPGGICISRSAYDQVRNRLKLDYEYLGEQQVKNIAEPVRAYRVGVAPTGGGPAEESDRAGRQSRTPERSARNVSLAVLPFKNMSGDPEQEYFSDGITEDLITDLSKISGLSVASQNTAFTYKGRAVKVQEVGTELGVSHVLEGSVRKAGNRVRITAQLIDAATDRHLWSERYDRELDDIFAVQDEISRHIVTALDVKLLHGEQAGTWRRTTQNPDAYYLFLRALDCMRSGYTREGCAEAKRLAERAVALDPDFARAYLMVMGPNLWEGRLGWSQSPDESYETALALIDKASSLNDSLPGVHLCRGLYHLFTMNHEQALSEGREAVRLGPESSDAFGFLGMIQAYSGEPAAAVESVRKSISLCPVVPPVFRLIEGKTYYAATRYEEAVSSLGRSLDDVPDSVLARVFLAASYQALGRAEEAQAEARQILRIEPALALDSWAPRALPFRNAADLERMTALLREAGLK